MSSEIQDLRREGWAIEISGELVTAAHIIYGQKSMRKGNWTSADTACQLASELINEHKLEM